MDARLLSALSGIVTAIGALTIAAVRMTLGSSETIGIPLTIAWYVAAAIITMLMARKRWDMDYKNAFVLVFSSSLICALLYSGGYLYLMDAIKQSHNPELQPSFKGLFFVNVAVRLPIDLVVAIFRKRPTQ